MPTRLPGMTERALHSMNTSPWTKPGSVWGDFREIHFSRRFEKERWRSLNVLQEFANLSRLNSAQASLQTFLFVWLYILSSTILLIVKISLNY